MAAGQFKVIDKALVKIGEEINLASDDFNVVLTTKAQAIGVNFAGASGNAQYSDLTAEVVGTGYTAKGEPLVAPDFSLTGAVASFIADPTVWNGLTATMKYAVVVKNVGGTLSHILGYFDLETTDPDGRASSGGDFVITWTGGLFTLTRAA